LRRTEVRGDEGAYDELVKGWNAQDEDKQEEFKLQLIDELH